MPLLKKKVGDEQGHSDDESCSGVFPESVFRREDFAHDGSRKDHGKGRSEECRPDQ